MGLVVCLWRLTTCPDLQISFMTNWPLAKVPEVAHILSFYSTWLKLSLIFALRAAVFQDTVLKNAIIGHEIWPLAKVPEVVPIFSFYPMGSRLSLFSLYGQRFPRYGPIFKIVISARKDKKLPNILSF